MSKYNFFYYLWIIIIMPKSIQIVFLMVFLIKTIYQNGFPKKIPKEITPLICFSILHLTSVLVNAFLGYGSDRFLAGLNTSIIWVVGILYYVIYSSLEIDPFVIQKIILRNYIVYIFISIIALFLGSINRPVSILSRNLFNQDWFMNESSFRLVAFMEYPNLAMLFGIILLPWVIDYLKNKNKLIFLIGIAFSIFPIYMTKSRMGIILVLVGVFYLILFNFFSSVKNKIYFFFFFFFLIIIFFINGGFDDLLIQVNNIISGREGSSSAREGLYKESLEIVLNRRPMIGMGIKTIHPIFNVPYGSHSTYIGAIYKTGIVGFVLLLVGFIKVLYKLFSSSLINNKTYHFVFYLLLFISLAIEDIDGNNWVFVLIFTIFSCFNNIQTKEKVSL